MHAIKILKKKHIIDSKQLEHTLTEKQILSAFSHPFLVASRQFFQSSTKIYFVMEFLKGGELFQHLKHVVRFREDQVKFICACLVSAIGHLHNHDYIYRDIKPENILLDEDGYAKLTDFGLAKHIKLRDLATTFCGTPEYLPPEVILNKGCNRAADWWGLGILIYEMLFGAPPFYSKNVQEMYKHTLLKQVKFPAKHGVSKACLDFIAGLLVKVPSKRLGSIADSLEVMNNPWFIGFNWDDLNSRSLTPPFKPQTTEWEVNFDADFIREEPRDSKCDIDIDSLTLYTTEFDLFNEKNALTESNESCIEESLGFFFRENLLREAQCKIQDKKESVSEDKPILENDLNEPDLVNKDLENDKENPSFATPLKRPSVKKPFTVIYKSPITPSYQLNDFQSDGKKTET
jgi:serum/glucocorticoid-regulated kinase 2